MAMKRLYSRNCLPSPGMQPIKFPSGCKESLFLLSPDGTVTDYILPVQVQVEENYAKKDCKKRCGFSCLPQSLLRIRRVLN
jgi:hypothetical protein